MTNTIINTEQHTRTALIVEPFGTDGAVHVTPIDGDRPGRAFILDAASARELARVLARIGEDVEVERMAASFEAI